MQDYVDSGGASESGGQRASSAQQANQYADPRIDSRLDHFHFHAEEDRFFSGNRNFHCGLVAIAGNLTGWGARP